VVTVTQEVEHFLGLHITEWPDGSRLLSQPGLLKKLFEKHPQIATLTKFPSVPMATTFCDEVKSASVPDMTLTRSWNCSGASFTWCALARTSPTL
jgi:hypothetical protein